MRAKLGKNAALLLGAVAAYPAAAAAAPSFGSMFGDHAVIQRDHPVIVRGRAAPGEVVTVTLNAVSRRSTAGADGRFEARFDPVSTAGPISLIAEAPSGRVEAKDVVVGDVFLCSGQSNMEMEVRYAQDAMGQVRGSADDQLRLMTVAKAVADEPRADFDTPPVWKAASPQSVPEFSAVCYYMARELRKSAGVPVGAIASSWGGSQISPWMGEAAQAAVG
ncbi:MAG: 9-O-acetylesterase, partial [Sphingobium sp.]